MYLNRRIWCCNCRYKCWLTLTRVVFELYDKNNSYYGNSRLTLTRVVFEYVNYNITRHTDFLINLNKSCIWICHVFALCLPLYLINLNKSCIWMQMKHKSMHKMLRLTLTRVVFEFYIFATGDYSWLMINLNKSCIWMILAFLLLKPHE